MPIDRRSLYLLRRQNARAASGSIGSDPLSGIVDFLANNAFAWVQTANRIEAAGKVTSFPDNVAPGVGAKALDPNHAFTQSNGAGQIAAITRVAAYNNQEVATWVKAVNTFYVSTLAPSAWTVWHSGVGGYVLIIASSTTVSGNDVAASSRSSTTGITFYRSNPNYIAYYASNGTTSVVAPPSAGGTVPSGVPRLWRAGYVVANTPDSAVFVNGVQSGAGMDQQSAPTASDPQSSMIIGGDTVSTDTFGGNIADWFFVKASSNIALIEQNVLQYARLKYLMP
jgi:hypothetical protein